MVWTRRGVLAGAGAMLCGQASGAIPSTAASLSVLRRLIGRGAQAFDFKLEQDGGTHPWFQVDAGDGRVAVTANSPVGLVRGANAYLNATDTAQINWEGERLSTPSRWPDLAIARSATFFRHRAYLNPCAYGYTTPFWDWSRWEREIDWMALHGIDMPLALEGQEYVWRQLWADAGLSSAELAAYFCGPAFLPWQRMGNIEGYGGPLPLRWMEKKRALQLRILERMRALGMTPILPGFAGYVPKAFAERHPGARIHKMTPWGGFHETYWLDPTDPLFAALARGFAEYYKAAFGEGTYYLADAFNEMRPPVDGMQPADRAAILARYGRSLYEALKAASPGAVLTMQGWLFSVDPDFWDEASVAAFLRDIPDDGLLILDIANDTFKGVWEKNKAFSGKPWIFGYIHDFGGNNPLFGDFPLVRKDLGSLPERSDTGRLEGFGVFPEGLNTNSVVYDYMFDRAWPAKGSPDDIDTWLTGYLKTRYGAVDAALLAAWADLWRAVYQVANWSTGWWRESFGCYLFCKRPDVKFAEFGAEPGDYDRLRKAVTGLAAVAPRYRGSALFKYDLTAATVHCAMLHVDRLLLDSIRTLKTGDPAPPDWPTVRRLALKIDDLLGAQPFGLAQWIDEARRYADTPEEGRYYVENAKTQITIWGGDAVLQDYASKAWQGMVRHFYLPRWTRFVEAQRKAILEHAPFDQKRFTENLVAWETAWARSPRDYPRRVPSNPVASAKALLKELQ